MKFCLIVLVIFISIVFAETFEYLEAMYDFLKELEIAKEDIDKKKLAVSHIKDAHLKEEMQELLTKEYFDWDLFNRIDYSLPKLCFKAYLHDPDKAEKSICKQVFEHHHKNHWSSIVLDADRPDDVSEEKNYKRKAKFLLKYAMGNRNRYEFRDHLESELYLDSQTDNVTELAKIYDHMPLFLYPW